MNLSTIVLGSALLGALSLPLFRGAPAPAASTSAAACCALPDFRVAEADGPALAKPAFERVKELVGRWAEADEQGRAGERIVTEFRLTAGGNAVLETHFPGTEMEMVSLYFMEKDELRLTHFCVLGNHPTLVASDAQEELVFRCAERGANFASCKDVHHMHEGRYRRLAHGRLESLWTPMESGQLSKEPVRALLVRKE